MKGKLIAAIVGLCVVLGGGLSHADPGTTPFPHTIATPFPWSSIQGVWETTDHSTGTQFSFDVLRDNNGSRVLHVTQFDGRSGAVLASGVGYQSASNPNTVEVFMRSQKGGPNFEVVLQSYADTHTGKAFNVMTVGPATPDDYDVLQRVGMGNDVN